MAKGGRALVIGSGIAGLLAARALADRFDEVVVLERDAADATAAVRPGAAQGSQVHVLLAGGQRAMNRLLPGLDDDWRAAGAVEMTDSGLQRAMFMAGGWVRRAPNGVSNMQMTRPLLERTVRARVAAWPGVAIRYEVTSDSLVIQDGRVRGVMARAGEGAEERIDADFVVDASGRGSFASQDFKANGFASPREDIVGLDFSYATALFDPPPDFDATCLGVLVAPMAPQSEGALLSAVEDGRWIVALAGRGAARPPADLAGFRAYAQRASDPVVGEWVARAKLAGDIKAYRFPSGVHRRFDVLEAHPEGFLPIGDAICSFNPVYGQGMTVASMEAAALHELLADGDLDGLWRRFHPRAAAIVAGPWGQSTQLDMLYPETQIERPPDFESVARRFRWAQGLIMHDPVLGRRMANAINLIGEARPFTLPELVLAQARRWLGLAPLGRAPAFVEAPASAMAAAAA